MNRKVSGYMALILAVIVSFSLFISVSAAESQGENPESGNILVTYDYINQLKETLKEEIIAELKKDGLGTGSKSSSDYRDITAAKGQMIVLGSDSELIYRGGGAVVITASEGKNKGVFDMSEEKELHSGQPLEYGHIYFASESDARKCVLVTGRKACFTVKGSYELR